MRCNAANRVAKCQFFCKHEAKPSQTFTPTCQYTDISVISVTFSNSALHVPYFLNAGGSRISNMTFPCVMKVIMVMKVMRISPHICISLHLSAFLYISLHFSTFLCLSLPFYAPLCIHLHFAAFLCISLHLSEFLCISRHFSAFFYTSLHFSTFLCILHFIF